MRWLIKEPSFWAIVVSVCISLFAFLYRWSVVSGIFQEVYRWFPNYAKVFGISSLVFGVLATSSFIWFVIVVFKKRKGDEDKIDMLINEIRKVLDELENQKRHKSDTQEE